MQRKSNKKTRGPNSQERNFQNWLLNRSCCVSGIHGVELHHMYGSTFRHNKILIGHAACLPLSFDYHRGINGIHTLSDRVWCDRYGSQASFWIVHHDLYVNNGNDPLPNDVVNAIMDWGR